MYRTVPSTEVKFTYTTTMSASRVGGAEGMDVDEAGVAPPTNEWMEAARKAAVRRHGRHPRERAREAPEGVQSMLHAHSPALANPAQECTQKERVSPESTRASRTIVRELLQSVSTML